jgi:hypothetical protein
MLDRATFHELVWVLGLDTANQLAEELMFIANIWIINDLGEQVILVLGAAQIHVGIVGIKNVS